MREIKFRVWDKQSTQFYYSGIFNGALGFFKPIDKESPDIAESVLPDHGYIQQFTGLKDKNNKEIYEGDIVKFCYFESWMNNDCNDIYQGIFYHENLGAFRMGSRYVIDNYRLGPRGMELTSDCEIVGNIFENSDWLK